MNRLGKLVWHWLDCATGQHPSVLNACLTARWLTAVPAGLGVVGMWRSSSTASSTPRPRAASGARRYACCTAAQTTTTSCSSSGALYVVQKKEQAARHQSARAEVCRWNGMRGVLAAQHPPQASQLSVSRRQQLCMQPMFCCYACCSITRVLMACCQQWHCLRWPALPPTMPTLLWGNTNFGQCGLAMWAWMYDASATE